MAAAGHSPDGVDFQKKYCNRLHFLEFYLYSFPEPVHPQCYEGTSTRSAKSLEPECLLVVSVILCRALQSANHCFTLMEQEKITIARLNC
jgi:hypothetical protein